MAVANQFGGNETTYMPHPTAGIYQQVAQAYGQPIPAELSAAINSEIQLLKGSGLPDAQIVQAISAKLSGSQSSGQSDTGTSTDPMAALQALLNGGGNQPSAFSLQGFIDLGLSPEQAQLALLKQFGLGTNGGYSGETGSSVTNANANMMNAVTNQAQQRATEAYQQGQLLVQNGQLDLAKEQFASAEYWTGVANDLSQRKFGVDTAQGVANTAGQYAQIDSNDRAGRGALELGAAGQYGNLATLMGNLATTQANMGISLLTNPRNASAAFLLGQGADPSKAAQFGNFDVQRLLGIDPAQIQNMINAASQAAEQAQSRAQQPSSLDLGSFLTALQNAATAAQSGGGGTTESAPKGGTKTTTKPKPESTTPKTSGTPETNFSRTPTGTVVVKPSNSVVRSTGSTANVYDDPGPRVNWGQGDMEDQGPLINWGNPVVTNPLGSPRGTGAQQEAWGAAVAQQLMQNLLGK